MIFFIRFIIIPLPLNNFFIFTMNNGTVKFYDETKGFGFIKDSNSSTEYFVHSSGLIGRIRDNDQVTFDLKEGKKGLTSFGIQVVQKMNELGMIVDVSHVGEQTFWDIIKTTTKPIMASHSSVYSLVHHRRNLKDEQIKAIAKNGGVIQINFNPGFIDSSYDKKEAAFIARHKEEYEGLQKNGMPEFYALDSIYHEYKEEANSMRPPLSLVIDHIDYVAKLVGVDYVGIGSDFDGINNTPQQLNDVTDYPLITKALLERGYSKKDIDKILGGNFLRVLKANEKNK